MTQLACWVWDNIPPGFLPQWLNDSAWNGKPTGLYSQEGSSANWDVIVQQANQFSEKNRAVLFSTLQKQTHTWLSVTQQESLQLLQHSNTFTVTTGQQLHFDLGPAYVLFKITSAIALSKDLKRRFPHLNFIPVYWLASEDHDFQEISTSTIFNKDWKWVQSNPNPGPVGRMSVDSLMPWLEWLKSFFNNNAQAQSELQNLSLELKDPHTQLSGFLQKWILRIFDHTPLLVLNPDDAELKQLMVPLFSTELENGTLQSWVAEQNARIRDLNLEAEAYVRRVNLFYLNNEIRERIEFNDGQFHALVSGKKWSNVQILQELSDFPERFSPNVLLRPLYQQTILPNVAYVAGPSEYKYWLQIHTALENCELTVPALVLRKSGVFLSENQLKKLLKWDISLWDLFAETNDSLQQLILEKSSQKFNLDNDVKKLSMDLEAVYSQLFTYKSEFLKSFKQQGDRLIGELNKIARLEREQSVKRSISDQEWQSIQNLKQSIANASNPQERSYPWIQEYIKDPSGFKQLIDLLVVETIENSISDINSSSEIPNSTYFDCPFQIIQSR